MSYILEALRKSDRERRLGRPPRLLSPQGDADALEHRAQWFFGGVLLIVLVAAVAIVGWYYFGNTSPTMATRVTDLATKRSLTAADLTGSESSKQSKNHQEPGPAGSEQLLSQTAVSKPTSGHSLENVEPVVSLPTTIIEYINLEPAIRARWPELTLNVISYGRMVQQRFVMINQKIFRTGQAVGKDLKLEKIEADAVIMRSGAMYFRLYPR